jgi:hypothetical protein
MGERICSIDGCNRTVKGHGWCSRHYQRWKVHGDPTFLVDRSRKTCSVDGCEDQAIGWGWCSKHYQRWQTHGDPTFKRGRATCSVDGCEKLVTGHGWCPMHLRRWQKTGSVGEAEPQRQKQDAPCTVDGCDRPQRTGGLCGMHYQRLQTNGNPLTVSRLQASGSVENRTTITNARFDASYVIDPETGCHRWTGHPDKDGYSQFKAHGRNVRGHVFAYERKYGPVPDGKVLDHYLFSERCYGPPCVNGDHVRPVTPRENTLRGDAPAAWNRAKMYCKRGHEFTDENTRVDRRGLRSCRICNRANQRARYYRRKRQAANT